MLHNKFQGHRPCNSLKEDSTYGCGGHLGYVTQISKINLSSLPLMRHMQCGFDWTREFGDVKKEYLYISPEEGDRQPLGI